MAVHNLKIGDVVLLLCNQSQEDNSSCTQKSGFILADLSGSHSHQRLIVQPAETSDQDLPNLQFGTFKVLFSNKYEAQSRCRELLGSLSGYKRKRLSEGRVQLLKVQATQAKRDGKVEQAENLARQKRLQGSNVYYGDSIQLQHTLTGKYIHVSTTETSSTEKTKLKVSLQKGDSVGCIFRLQPQIKVQTIGEEVNYDDHVKFESVAVEGQFLHCSKKTFANMNIHAFSDCFELNLAACESSIRIIHHHQPIAQKESELDCIVKGSSTVRFFHHKHQCYIEGEGSFVGHHGKLENLAENDKEGVKGIAASIERSIKKTCIMSQSKLSQMIKVEVEMESVVEDTSEVVFSNQLSVPESAASFTLPGSSITSIYEELGNTTSMLEEDEVVTEDVHFRKKRKPGNILSSKASTSPDTFWQIEKYNHPYSGEPILWVEECRIRHLPTRRYLAVTGTAPDYKVTLKSSKLDSSCMVFQLFPITEQGKGEIDYRSRVRVKHKSTETWLHYKDLRYIVHEDPLKSPGYHDFDDSHELVQVVVTKSIDSDDAFTLEKVDKHLVTEFNNVAGITAVLADQLQMCESIGGQFHSPHDCRMGPALASLNHLLYLLDLSKDDSTLKYLQKLIRSLRTLVLVIRLLNLHRNEESNDPEVCSACFGIINNFLRGNSKKSKSYVSSMMRNIFTSSVTNTELVGSLTVEKALLGLITDNPSMLHDNGLMKLCLGYVMQKLKDMTKLCNKAVQMVEILASMCDCKGVPVEQNQNIILELLQDIYKDGETKLLYPLRIQSPSPTDQPEDNNFLSDTKACRTDHSQNAVDFHLEIPLFRISASPVAIEDSEDGFIQFQAIESVEGGSKILKDGCWYEIYRGDKHVHEFLLAEIHLLHMMCKGNNTKVIKVLQGVYGTQTFGLHINLSLIMCAIRDGLIKQSYPRLRAALIELLRVMYVEIGDNHPFLENFPCSFVISEVCQMGIDAATKSMNPEKASITALTGVENIHFPTIRDWIQNFFQDESEYFFAAESDDMNSVVVSVLKLLTILVKYGNYNTNASVNPLLPAISKLLNGSEDFPTKKIKQLWTCPSSLLQRNRSIRRSDRWRAFRQQRLSLRFDFLDVDEIAEIPEDSYESLEKALMAFRDGGRFEYVEENRNYYEIKQWAMEFLNVIFNYELYQGLQNFIYDFRWLSQRYEVELQQMLEMTEFEWPNELRQELSYLIDTNPRDPEVFRRGPEEATKVIASAEKRLRQISAKRDEDLPGTLLDLANYKYDKIVQQSLLLLDRYYTSETDIFERAIKSLLINTYESTQMYNRLKDLLLRLVGFLRSSGVADDSGPSPVAVLTKYCWLENEVEGFEPHQINQNIIISFGIFPDVLNYILQYSNGTMFVKGDRKRKLIDCLKLLRALVCKNKTLLTRLVKYLDIFIKAASGEFCIYFAELIREIFSAGPFVSLSVNQDQIWRLMWLIFSRDKENQAVQNTYLLDALIELLTVRELALPLKYNQQRMVKSISLIREDDRFMCQDLLADGMCWKRWSILTSRNESDIRVVNLLMITDLLATCANGENTGMDSVCCTIYSENELIDIISSDVVPIYRKRPFMKMLVWVYMNVRGSKEKRQILYHMNNKKLWDHMTKMAAVLLRTSEIMSSMSHSAYLSVKEQLASPMWKYSHQCPDQKHADSPPPVVLKGRSNYKEHFNISDVLLYFSEGFLPYLQALYGGLCIRESDEVQTEEETTFLLYKALLAFCDPLNCKRVYFPQDIQVRLFYRVLYLIDMHNTCEYLPQELLLIKESLENKTDVFSQEVVSQAREDHKKRYQKEVELNLTFNRFVINYKSAYEGRNTKKEQILHPPVGRNAQLEDECYSEFLDEDQLTAGIKYLPLGKSFQQHVALFHSSGSTKLKERNPKAKLLKQLEISLSKAHISNFKAGNFDTERQIELDVKCLQILRASIYNHTILIDEKDKDCKPKMYRRLCEQHLHPIQNEIQDLGNTVVQLMPLLTYPDSRVVCETLALLETILDFGNTHVQEGLRDLTRLKQTKVLPTLTELLKKGAVVYHETQVLTTLIKSRVISDQTIASRAKMMGKDDDDIDGPDIEFLNTKNVEAECSTVRQFHSSKKMQFIVGTFFRRTEKLIVLSDQHRVPFLALYQHPATSTYISAKAQRIIKYCDLMIGQVCLVSKILGLMCDTQFRIMQNYIRDQTEDFLSVNMVEQISSFLYQFSKEPLVGEECLQLLNNLLQTLNEFCIGNHRNREITFNGNIITVINYVLQIDITGIRASDHDTFDTDEGVKAKINYVHLRELALFIKVSAVQLLDALLEEIKKDSNLSRQIAEGLDIRALHWSMYDFYTLKSDPDFIRIQADDNALRALFGAYKVFMNLVNRGVATFESLVPTDKAILKAWDYCAERSRSIEIVYRDADLEEEVLTRVHFNVNIETEIREELQDSVKFQVNRNTHADKLRDFHDWMIAVKKDTLHHEWLRRKKLHLVKIFSRFRYWLLLLTILILNILTIVHSDDDTMACPSVFAINTSISGTLINPTVYIESVVILGAFFFALSVWMLVDYFVTTWPHFVMPRLDMLPIFNYTYFSVNIFGVQTIYLLLFIPISFSPLYCLGYIYCIAFLYIIINNDILQRALLAITKNWKSLFWVGILLLIIIYFYAILVFEAYSRGFQDTDNFFCDSIDQCMTTILRFGLTNDFLDIDVANARVANEHLFLDVSFFIIVSIIGLNIVFGIILDTFSELRDLKYNAERDMRNKCFICGIPSHKFDKLSNNGFTKHVSNDHNMWNYIYYSIYLDQIDTTNHNAIEKYIYEKMKAVIIDYLPFEKALVLEGHTGDETVQNELEQLGSSMKGIMNRLDKIENSLRDRKK